MIVQFSHYVRKTFKSLLIRVYCYGETYVCNQFILVISKTKYLNFFYKIFCSLLIYCPQLKFFRRQRRVYSGHSFTFIFYKTFILNVRKLIFAGFREGNKGISETAKFAFHTDHKNCILSNYPEQLTRTNRREVLNPKILISSQ